MILIDMNLSPAWVSLFEESGIPSVHWSSIGAHDAPDAMIMDYARENKLIVFIHDLDFTALPFHTRARSPGVIQVRGDDVRPSTMGPFVIRAVTESADILSKGALLTVDSEKRRIAILPLGS